MSISMDSLERAIRALHGRQNSNFSAVAGLTLYVYDILLTLDDEYKYIWQARWSLGNVLYLVIRYPWLAISVITIYMNVSPNVSDTECNRLLPVKIYTGLLQGVIVQFAMVLRTYAIYQKKKWVLYFLGSLLVLCSGADLALVIRYIGRIKLLPPLDVPVFAGCVYVCDNCEPLYRWFWVPQAIIDFAITALTFLGAIQHAKCFPLLDSPETTPLLAVLYRDGFAYFAVIFGVEVLHLIIWNAAPPSKPEILSDTMRTMYAIIGARLLLNIRGALTDHDTSILTNAHPDHGANTTIRFASSPGNGEETIFMNHFPLKSQEERL